MSLPFLIEPFYYNWLILGVIFLIIEVSTFTLLFLWLAIAAAIMAAISFFSPTLALSAQLLIFSVFSVLSVIFWHKLFRKKQDSIGDAKMNNRAHRYIGRTATLVEAIENGRGKIQIEDSFWRVECDADIPAGDAVEIIDADGVILKVRAK